MAYIVQDLTGKEYALEAEIELTEEENGMVTIDLKIQPTENNQKFIRDINEHWTISGIKTAQYGKFYIQHLEKVGVGDWPQLQITAVAEFIHKLQTTTFDGYYTGSRTAVSFFNELSLQSGITFQPIDFKPAFGWEKFGLGVHNISEFNRGLNNYGYTYYPVTSQLIELRNQIGRDTNFMIKNAMNSDSMEMEIDRTEVYTYVEGYADYTEEDGEDFYEAAKLYSFYKHPVLYDLLGELKAETYKNQKINNKVTLDEYLKNIVDNSIKFTITTDFHQIEDYPFAVPMLGDRIRVQDDAIDINTTARVIKIKTLYDIYGDVLSYELDFGNFPVSERVKSQLSSVQRQMEDLISGRTPVNTGMLDSYIGAVIEQFKNAESEIMINGYNGMNGFFLVDPTNPNNAVGIFSQGIGVTNNGFSGGVENNLAIVPGGIVADTIRVGTLWLENFLGIIGKDSLLELNAEYFRIQSANDPSKFLEMNINTGFTIGGLPFTQIAPDGRVLVSDGYMTGQPVANLNLWENDSIAMEGHRDLLITTDVYHNVYTIYDQWRSNRLDLLINYSLTSGSAFPFRYLEIQVVDMYSDGIVYSERLYIYREPTDGQDFKRLTIDLKTFYNGIVDFRNLHFYVRVRMLNPTGSTARFRVNKGEVYD